jgi:hypothetical protein
MKNLDEILEEVLSQMTEEEFAEMWSKTTDRIEGGISVEEYFGQLESGLWYYHFGNSDNDFGYAKDVNNDYCLAA